MSGVGFGTGHEETRGSDGEMGEVEGGLGLVVPIILTGQR